MKDLVEIYSTQEILLFLVIFASAVKGFVSFWDWGYGRLKQMFKKENDKEQEIDSIQTQFNEHIKNYEIMQNTQNETLRILTDKINYFNFLNWILRFIFIFKEMNNMINL